MTVDLDQIRARVDAATPGPWWGGNEDEWAGCVISFEDDLVCGLAMESEVEFIAHARTDIPALVNEIEEHKAKADALVSIIRGVIEATRPGTDPEEMRLAWKRAGIVLQLDDARANETEFLQRLTRRLIERTEP